MAIYPSDWGALLRRSTAEPAPRHASDPRRAGRAGAHEKRPQRPRCCRERGSARPRSGERRRPEPRARPAGRPRSVLRASAAAVPRERGLGGAADASPWAAGAGHARRLWQLAVACWAEALHSTAAKRGRALGPMLPASARGRCPFCVLRAPCHAALRRASRAAVAQRAAVAHARAGLAGGRGAG